MAIDPEELKKAKNPMLYASYLALKRAGEMARKKAIETETGIVVVRDGERVHISAAELREGKR